MTPTTAPDVALAVKILVGANVQFAVRGGGHTAWAGGEYCIHSRSSSNTLGDVDDSCLLTLFNINSGKHWKQWRDH